MRVFILLLLFSPFACLAQDKSILEKFAEAIIGTECEQHIKDAIRNTANSIEFAEDDEWDAAFYYNEQAFFSLLSAISYCRDEPENLQNAERYFEDHKDIDQQLTCSYHALEAEKRITAAKIEFLDNGDYKEALYEANWGMYYLEEAVKWCDYDLQKVEELLVVMGEGYRLVDLIKNYVYTDVIEGIE